MTTLSQARNRVHEAMAENPSTMPDSLARKLGISEAEVIRCLPEEMRVEAPASDFEAIWKTMTGWEKVTFIARNPGAVVEVVGPLPKGVFGHGMFNLMDKGNPLRGHLLVDRLGSIFLVSKPFFKLESHSVQFFDSDGTAMFSVYLGRDDKRALIPTVLNGFLELRGRYARPEAA